ncbi:ABC transporter permease [Metabacillus arenae]|uniref:ABC transporter permease n=1 Tax=Metabacillus arenae TaxID=2771434 RepID=A0A926NMS1_9BACI|nr:ABC transporter permease [Metabacillus arenae]MBD1380676.1 ABC transporter permease [Metabacillus arenae]
MFTALFGSVESGLIYAIMALGVYLSFRILDFPDLTVDGSFVTGAAVAAVMIVSGFNPFLATGTAFVAGFLAGSITGLLHTKGKINALLSGILMMIALYSINLRIMDKPNVPLHGQETVFTIMGAMWEKTGIDQGINGFFANIGMSWVAPSTWLVLFVMFLFIILLKGILDYFLKTEVGLAIRAVGDNHQMITSFSGNTDTLKIAGLGLSNALVSLSGAFVAQTGGYADVGMGIGMIIIGLASVIIGEAILGIKTIFRATLAVILGAIIYRVIVALSLRVDFLETGDMKLITAIIVIAALIIPQLYEKQKEKRRKKLRLQEKITTMKERGDQVVRAQSDL